MAADSTRQKSRSSALMDLLTAERRRNRRGLDQSQLVCVRLAPDDAPADRTSLLTGFAQACDSALLLDSDTAVLFMPQASLAAGRACLRKILAQPALAGISATTLLATLPAEIWDRATPAQALDALAAGLDQCEPGAPARHIVLLRESREDGSRVTAQERSFLLSVFQS